MSAMPTDAERERTRLETEAIGLVRQALDRLADVPTAPFLLSKGELVTPGSQLPSYRRELREMNRGLNRRWHSRDLRVSPLGMALAFLIVAVLFVIVAVAS